MPQPTWQVVTIVEILRGDVTSGATSGAIDEVIRAGIRGIDASAIIPKWV
jgi:hypothetical protein